MNKELITNCQVGNGIINVPTNQDLYETYRTFIELFEDAQLPVRKVISLSAETSSSKNTASMVFGRQMNMKENMIRLIQNVSQLIFPVYLEFHDMKISSGIGDVWSDEVIIMSHGKQVKPLNRVYLFHSDIEVDVSIQTKVATGTRYVETNAADLLYSYHIPILSSHELWDQVRFSGFNEENHSITYVLTNFSEQAFQQVLNEYLYPKGKKPIEKSADEFPNYNNQGFWAELTYKMRTDLKFQPADQRGWTAIMRHCAPIKTLKDFEEHALLGDTKSEVIEYLADIKMVSNELAIKVVNFFEPRIARRLL